MIKRNLTSLSLVLSITLGISACAMPFSREQTQRPPAPHVYAQLTLGYMDSGRLNLTHQQASQTK